MIYWSKISILTTLSLAEALAREVPPGGRVCKLVSKTSLWDKLRDTGRALAQQTMTKMVWIWAS